MLLFQSESKHLLTAEFFILHVSLKKEKVGAYIFSTHDRVAPQVAQVAEHLTTNLKDPGSHSTFYFFLENLSKIRSCSGAREWHSKSWIIEKTIFR